MLLEPFIGQVAQLRVRVEREETTWEMAGDGRHGRAKVS